MRADNHPEKRGQAIKQYKNIHNFRAHKASAKDNGEQGPRSQDFFPPLIKGWQNGQNVVDGDGRGNGDDAADLVGGKEPTAVAITGITVGHETGPSKIGNQDDTGIEAAGDGDTLCGQRLAIFLIYCIQKYRNNRCIKGLGGFLNVR